MKRLLYAFILLFGMFSVHGQSVWIGAVDSDWTNPANWSAGVPTAGSVATIPANPTAPVFGGTPIINYTIQLAGMLTFNDFVFNAGTIIIFESGTVVNNGQFINANSRVLDVDGHFENNGTLDNFGMIDIAATGSVDNETGAILNNNNNTLAFGPVFNAGTYNNNGYINIIVSLDNSGTFNNTGTFESQSTSTVENRVGAVMETFTGGSYSVNGIYNNLGDTFNRGDFIVQSSGVFTNEDLLLNRTNGNMEVAGRIINNNVITINGPLMINSIGIIENNNIVNNNVGIDIEICGNLFQLNTNNIGGSIQNNGSVYEINGTINETNLEFGETFTDVDSRPLPIAACLRDAFLQLTESEIVTFTAADIEQGRSFGSCGAALVSTTVSPNSFTSADVGVRIVTITVTDEFGNSASCEDFVTVLPFTPPIVPIDDADISFECPEDVMATTEPGAQFAPASFTIPEATTTCSPATAMSATLCPDVSENISGFNFIGQVGGSKYFVSHDSEDWTTANSIAQANGGHLVTIDDAAENAFITDNVSGSVWIGLRSLDNANSFSWASGAPVDYLNWSAGEPNNTNGDPDVAARLVGSSGLWTDRYINDHFNFVIEVSCFEVEIPGFDFLGTNEGSLYYESHATSNWTDAANAATAIGGSLVTINNAAENTYIQNAINPSTGSIWTGLTNNDNGNNFVWQSGEAVNYTNWNTNEPNGTTANVAARLVKSHGRWTDRGVSDHFEFVVEIPAPSNAPACLATGTITREVWTGIGGTSVSNIPLNMVPNLTEEISSFEGPTNDDDMYGTRVRGFIHPQVTGNYEFWIATDDNGELWLSTNDDPANRTRIAFVSGFTSSRQWNKFPEQRSALIHLEAGQRYYIEALQKESFGGDNLAVRWRLPDGTIQEPIPGSVLSGIDSCPNSGNGDPELTVTQIAGPPSGGNFPIGETPIIIEITDACGNQEICEFNVVVEDNPADFEVIDCPTDITINTLPGAVTAVATFNEPGGTSTCFRGGPVSVVQNLGLESGEAFPIGNTQITYAVFDSCGNFEGCNFNVNVVAIAAELSFNCPDDVILQAMSSTSTVTANWTEPTASTTCFAGGLTLNQVAGPANGSDLGVGTFPVIYVFTDACNNTEICTFNVVVNSCPDADGDGICAADDCDDNDASLPATPGTTCDDGDAGTINDMIGADGCSCAGIINPCILDQLVTVSYEDLLCEPKGEITFTFPDEPGRSQIAFSLDGGITYENNVFDNIGSITYGDLDAGTYELMVRWGDEDCPTALGSVVIEGNGASPVVTVTSTNDNCGAADGSIIFSFEDHPTRTHVEFSIDGGVTWRENISDTQGSYTYTDLDAGTYELMTRWGNTQCPISLDPVTISPASGTPGTMCNDGDAATENDVIGADGCSCAGTMIVACANEGGDADGDGICADVDCDDNDASLPAAPGTACDDGDAGTESDVIGADGCSCAGTPISTGCNPTFVLSPGNITVNGLNGALNIVKILDISNGYLDVVNCFGDCPTPASFDLPAGPYRLVVTIRDASGNTICELNEGIEIPDGTPPACTVGATCDDGDVCTDGDVYDADCNCAGTTVADNDGDGFCAVEDCDDNDASVPAAPGSACDDGNISTDNDVVGSDGCSCAGTPIATCTVAGGQIAFLDGSAEQTICAGDGVADPLDVNLFGPIGSNQQWIITDDASTILGLPAAPPFDLEGAGGGTCRIYSLSFDGNVTNLMTGANLSDLTGCLELSNAVEVIRLVGSDCPGQVVDNDGDGVPADQDCDDNDASLPTTPGTACDDGDAGTDNDVIGADGCSCMGTPINTGCNPGFILSPGNITVTGLNGALNIVKILDISNGFLDVVNCFGDCPTPASFDLPAGPYLLSVEIRDASGVTICELNETIEILDGCTTGASCNDNDNCTTGDVFDADCNCIGTPVVDNDGDGFCGAEDCDDNDASLPATPGTTCDDGDSATDNDVIGADGCTCAGVMVGACNPTAIADDNSLIIGGLSGPNNVIQIFNTANWSTVINCFGDCQNQVIDVDPGNYFVRLRVLDASYQEVCAIETNVVVGGSTFSIAADTEFLRLFAREENRMVGLNWVNNTEYRNDYFVIERSVDGVNFTELKTVDAYGYESQDVTNYQDEDIRPFLGEGYYRVRLVFEDGSIRYSNVERVSFDIDLTEVGLFPNPTETEVQLSLIDFAGRSAVIQIYSPLGLLMDAVTLEEIPERAIRFNVANYQAGLYTITVKVDQRKRFSKRFVKMRR